MGILVLSACKPATTGMATASLNETNSSKSTKYTIPDEPPKTPKESCENQLKDLQEQKTEGEYDLLQIKGEKQKISRELGYKKESPKYKEEVEAVLNKLRAFEDQSDDLKERIEDTKKAIRLLEEKCGIKA